MKRLSPASLLRLCSLGIAASVIWFAWQHGAADAARTHDFGPVPLNARLSHDLVIHNPTSALLPVVGAKPGCTCLQLSEPIPTGIAANGEITIRVSFVPEQLGPVKTSLTLDAPGLAQTEWLYVAEVVPPPEALPSPVALDAARGHLNDGTILPAAAAVSLPEDQRLVIDVRPVIDFQASTIVGAMNVPLSQMTALPLAMRTQKTLVLDRGYGAESTCQTVASLRRQGWKDLQVIEGGLSAWNAHGGRITSAESVESWLLSSSEARLNATKPGWIIAVPKALADSWRLKELFPEVLIYADPGPEGAATLADAINARRPGDGACTSVLHVLIATDSGENATLFAQSVRSRLTASPLFVLDGGLRGYLEHIRNFKPEQPRQWITMDQFAGALAELRTRQRLVTSCTSCPRQ